MAQNVFVEVDAIFMKDNFSLLYFLTKYLRSGANPFKVRDHVG